MPETMGSLGRSGVFLRLAAHSFSERAAAPNEQRQGFDPDNAFCDTKCMIRVPW
jgi:hypothetical protein